MINKKLESLETIERSTLYTKLERKNDSFLDLLERMKALNSEREFEPHHRSPLTKTMTENWHINSSRKDDRELKTIPTEKKQNSSIEIMQCKEDKKKDFDERKDYSYVVQKKTEMIEVDKEKFYRNNARRRCHGKNMYRS